MGCGAKCNFCGTLNSVCRCSGGNPVLIDKNTTEVIPVSGVSAYETWKAYYGTEHPDIDTEKKWIDAGYGVVVVEDLIVTDTIEDLRNLGEKFIVGLQEGTYKGVQVLGYYEKGDTPAPIEYYLSDTTQSDDGGSVIEVGGIKLEHDFGGVINPLYFGAQTGLTQAMLTKSNIIYEITSTLNIAGVTSTVSPLNMPSDSVLSFNGGSLNGGFLALNTSTLRGQVAGSVMIIELNAKSKFDIKSLTNMFRSNTGNTRSIILTSDGTFNFDKDVAIDTDIQFILRQNADSVVMDFGGRTYTNTSSVSRNFRSYSEANKTADYISSIHWKNATITNYNILSTTGSLKNNKLSYDYLYENITFVNCAINITPSNGALTKYFFSNCRFKNCSVQTSSYDWTDWGANMTVEDWVGNAEMNKAMYIFRQCDFVAGERNNRNVELLHLSDSMPYSRTVVSACNFYSEHDISSDYIDCYNSSNITIENCLFFGKIGGRDINGVLSAEPVFINIKSHFPSFGANRAESGYRDLAPFAHQQNVVVRGNTFIPIQPNEYSNFNVVSCIRATTFRRVDTTTTEFGINRLFTEITGNYVYLNNLNIERFSFINSLGGNKWNIIKDNKFYINFKDINFTTPAPDSKNYVLNQDVTIDQFSLYRQGRGAISGTDPENKLLDEYVFIEGNKILNKSSSDFKVIHQSNAGNYIDHFVVKDNFRQQNTETSPYNINVDISKITASGNNFDPRKTGTTAQRPNLSILKDGDVYFDTTLGKPIYRKNSTTWVDATGTTV